MAAEDWTTFIMRKNTISDRSDTAQGRTDHRLKRQGYRLRSYLALCAIITTVGLLCLFLAHRSHVLAQQPTRSVQKRLALAPPTHLAITGLSDGGIFLSWQENDVKAVGYRIYRAVGASNYFTIIGSVNAADNTGFSDVPDDLAVGMTYAYTVTAYNHLAESLPAGPVMVAIQPPTKPVATPSIPGRLPTIAPMKAPTLTAIAQQKSSAPTSIKTVIHR